jgi:uncharacterized membrane protein
MIQARANLPSRRAYLDRARGIAVLLMIEAHLLDSWTRIADKSSFAYQQAMIVGGMGTATFLMLAGVAVALSAGSKARRLGSAAAASNAVVRRGLQIFGLALLFRLQAFVLGWSDNYQDLLKVDILNIMGPSIVAAALLWRTASSARGRCLVFGAAALLTTFVTPALRQASFQPLPDFLEAYLTPVAGLSNFVFFPWTALVFAGAVVGVLIDAAVTPTAERRTNVALGACGAALAAGAYAASYLPSVVGQSYFWSSSPAYLLIRVGLVTSGIAAAYAWHTATSHEGRWSPIVTLGRTSLFIYWIHVELVYGLISRSLHHQLTLPQAWTAYALFTGLMVGCSELKTRVTRRRRVLLSQSPVAA